MKFFSRISTSVATLLAVSALLGGCASATDFPTEERTASHAEALTASNDVTIQGRRLMLNGAQYQVRGVDFAPIAIGASPDAFYGEGNRDGDGGDVFGNPYFESQLAGDIAKMREMGVNTIRVYQMHPWDPQKGPGAERSHKKFLDMLWNGGDRPIRAYVAFPVSSDILRYKEVSEKPAPGVWSKEVFHDGRTFYVVEDEQSKSNGWAFNGPQTAGERRASDKRAFEALAKEVGSHPAVLGFVLSNELNGAYNRENPRFFSYMSELGHAVKAVSTNKHTILALIDDGMTTVNNVAAQHFDVSGIDVWGINSYRGRIGATTNDFDNLFQTYANASDKPLVMTEFGAPATTRREIASRYPLPVPSGTTGALGALCGIDSMTDLPDNAKLQADYIEGHWKHIDANKDIVSGGLVFEWQDEYSKAGAQPGAPKDVWRQSPSSAPVDAFPGGCWDEEGFGINAVTNTRGAHYWPATFIPDGRTPRAAFTRLQALWANGN